MKKINMNKFAVRICELEEGKCQVNIGQVKEILKCTMFELVNNHTGSEIFEMLERYVE